MNKFLYHIILLTEGCIRNISGGIGVHIRYYFYRYRFKKCGKNVRISDGVYFENPESIEVGDNVSILHGSIISGPGKRPNDRIYVKEENRAEVLTIGSETSIGLYNIINGSGSLSIGDRVTTSAHVAIYSHSHLPYLADRNRIVFANAMVKSGDIACIDTRIVLCDGVWLGIGVLIFQGVIGENTFVKSRAIVNSDLPANAICCGDPAVFKEQRFNV